MPKYGPYSKAIVLGKPSGRTKEGRLLKTIRLELFDHLGGEDNVPLPKRMLVERCCQLQLRLSLFEEKACRGELTDLDNRNYVCFTNSLARTLAALGLQRPTAPAPSLADHLAALGAREREGTAA